MDKKGDFSLPFGVIFSIIVIIAILGVAFYVLINFVKLGKCTDIGLFYNELKTEINKAWRAPISEEILEGKLPSDVELVCFGNRSVSAEREYNEVYRKLVRGDDNIFLYPSQKACDSNLNSIKLEHITFDSFFCIPVENGKVKIETKKTVEGLVKIKK